ncbi:type I 3-dehydroquinate dehydratase [Acetobacter fallax]|uniref:3-dehydroquinate dehydratase n=2 Tax=Acetobacter fallax TaxID=1737473 RepID=A0ABX0KAH0_9PROT|nr:type I 3-dehydroquinate dehydratase [Acetobacter fallax]NHO33400.1 type I 3-dehydroquinate dehydratase [Acetobacter fallax]NHO37019.1 type I 3-dehydroquinate dehydratase [Acetobacter fallax]
MLTSMQGEIPAVICPIICRTSEEAVHFIRRLSKDHRTDIVELRLDYMWPDMTVDGLVQLCTTAKDILGEKPLIATFRTHAEGGEASIADAEYVALKCDIAKAGCASYIDVEYNRGRSVVDNILGSARMYGMKTILSTHDFQKTDSEERLLEKLVSMKQTGPDIVKMAVMPLRPDDVLRLLSATAAMKDLYPDTPLITMSMGRLGAVSRLIGGVFGSIATFAAAGHGSAPGQMQLGPMRDVLTIISEASGSA